MDEKRTPLHWERPSEPSEEKPWERKKSTAIVLAIFFWYFVYLYLRDYKKFFTVLGINLFLNLLLIAGGGVGVFGWFGLLGMWIYILLDVKRRKYEQ